MQYTYEFELFRGETEWCITAFDFFGVTQGVDIEDACRSAADVVRIVAQDHLMRGYTMPRATFGNSPKHGGILVIVSVDTSLSDIPRVSASEAARMLGVSRSRVSAMLSTHLLEGWRDGRNTWVTKESVQARLDDPRPAGRPAKSQRKVCDTADAASD